LDARQFQFEWDEIKEAANMRKHGVSFEFASTVFSDPQLLTIADLAHSESEERWFRLACPATAQWFPSFTYEILQYKEAP